MQVSNSEKGKSPDVTVLEKGGSSTATSDGRSTTHSIITPAAPWVTPPPKGPSGAWVRAFKYLRAFAILILVGAPLSVPVIIFRDDALLIVDDDNAAKVRNLVYYIFAFLLAIWVSGWCFHGFACWLPFLFRFVARYVNPAHQRYWRIFRNVRMPVTLVLTILMAWALFFALLYDNQYCVVISESNDWGWSDTLTDLLFSLTLWIGFYTVEKIVITYICVHYHYHSNLVRITRSKSVHGALAALYDASVQLHPIGAPAFASEDHLIVSAVGNDKGLRRGTGSYLRRMGIDTYKMVSMFGTVVSADDHHGRTSHWFRPSQTYAVVERALGDEASATALATRIWKSMVLSDSKMLTKDDIAEVLGPFRKDEAEKYFAALDQSALGSLSLDDMISVVTTVGHQRHSIYAGMSNFNHVINTLDWVALFMITATILFLLLAKYVPPVKEIQQTASKLLLGLSFALGRTVHHFLSGAVFIIFDHAYDVGDRVEVWNSAASTSQSLIVVRLSLLYTVFKRCDNGVELQVANETLSTSRIENLSRGGVQKSSIKVTVDISTTFQDLCALRTDLETFVKANPRDYGDKIGLGIAGLNALDSMDIKCGYAHAGDFSDERAGGQRNMRFMCAFVTALRKVGIKRPHGQVGDQGRPMYTIMMDKDKLDTKQSLPGYATPTGERVSPEEDFEAAAINQLVKLPTAQVKNDDTATASGALIRDVSGLRLKVNQGTESMFHR